MPLSNSVVLTFWDVLKLASANPVGKLLGIAHVAKSWKVLGQNPRKDKLLLQWGIAISSFYIQTLAQCSQTRASEGKPMGRTTGFPSFVLIPDDTLVIRKQCDQDKSMSRMGKTTQTAVVIHSNSTSTDSLQILQYLMQAYMHIISYYWLDTSISHMNIPQRTSGKWCVPGANTCRSGTGTPQASAARRSKSNGSWR